MFACFLSQEEPKRVHQALKDPSWIEAMKEELLQFKMQKANFKGRLMKDFLLDTLSAVRHLGCGDQTRKQGDKAENKDKGKSPVVTIIGFRDLNEDTNDFSAAGPSNAAMPDMEVFSHNADDVGAEADINNMESIISTGSMARGVRDQGGISQMFNEDFHTCMLACFLSQEEALKDPSWIEAMQEELLQFKMQKVWILVDLPYGKRVIGNNGFIETKRMKEA
nr:putative ribonuclease H-like domain-containing protein [Tanacetum cinerariifolium]